jgi:hypothetical protein
MNTSSRQRILNRLGNACFGRMKQAFDSWKGDTFTKFAMEQERKKAKCIDKLVRANMSPLQRMFITWQKYCRDMNTFEYGQSVKAGFALYSVFNHKLRENRSNLLRLAFRKIDYDPIKLMTTCFEKMVRAAGLNLERAWLAWKIHQFSVDANAAKRARREAASRNFSNLIDTKKKNHLRAGVRRLADGVALTNG